MVTETNRAAASRQQRRSAFREEFYGGHDARARYLPVQVPPVGFTLRLRKSKRPLWVAAAGFGIVFCMIAVGGSTAMIWLRQVAALFGVHFIGD